MAAQQSALQRDDDMMECTLTVSGMCYWLAPFIMTLCIRYQKHCD
jgi:hypothetical protein